MILGVKLDRRLIAIVGLQDEQFVFSDSRFVPARAVLSVAVARYFQRLLEQFRPAAVHYYAPDDPGTVTAAAVKALDTEAGRAGVPMKPLSRFDLFSSVGILPLRTRQDLRACVANLWPGLAEGKPHRQTALAEAATAALVGDLRQAWPPV